MAASLPTAGGTMTQSQPARGSKALERARACWIEIPLLVISGVLLIGSIFLPYWNIVLRAPQYPKGLSVDVYVNKMEDMRSVREVDGLNHYIGMIKLTDAATIERTISIYAIGLIAILALLSIFLAGWWRVAARVPIVLYPAVFVIDLFAWLYYAGHNLDEKAALSSSISAFTPHIVGEGKIGQFSTEAQFEAGFWMALAAALLAGTTILIDWRRRRHGPAN